MPSGQISMLLSSVDSALRAGATATEDANSDATGEFIASFNAAMAKEPSSLLYAGQRQVPAAVSNLSEISLTLDQADIDIDIDTVLSDPTAELLSTNLLQQIALTNKSKANDANAVNTQNSSAKPDMHNMPVAETDAELADSEYGLVTQIIAQPIKLDNIKAELNAEVVIEDATTEEDTTEDMTIEESQTDSIKSSVANSESVKAETAIDQLNILKPNATSEQALSLQTKPHADVTVEDMVKQSNDKDLLEKNQSAIVSAKSASKDAKPTMSTGPVRITDAAEPDTELVLPEQAAKLNSLNQADTESLASLKAAADPSPKQVTTATATQAIQTGQSTNKDSAKAVVNQQPETELVLPEQASIAAADAGQKAQVNSAVTATVASPASKTESKLKLATEPKVVNQVVNEVKANTVQTDSSGQAASNSEQQTAAKQSDVVAQLAEKLTPLQNATPRSEPGFSAALANTQAAAVESRLAAASHNPTATPTQAEQLKQSINLMQQDAAGQMRQQVSLMLSQQMQKAEIRLDPAGLGMMQIKIDLQQDQATVQFTVQQHQAKELIEQQLPRLREMLQQQGIQLAEGQVQQQSQQQQQRQLAQQQGQQQNSTGDGAEGDLQGIPIQVTVKHSDRLVDYYA